MTKPVTVHVPDDWIGQQAFNIYELLHELTKTPQQTNKDGTVRGISRHLRLQETIAREERAA